MSKDTHARTAPSIYLAGKIDANDWRAEFAHRDLSYKVAYDRKGRRTDDVVLSTGEGDWSELATETNVFGLEMAGPFAMQCPHGCLSSSPHVSHGILNDDAQGPWGAEQSYCVVDATRSWVFTQCLEAIRRADVVFAWLDYDAQTAYGTLVEVGYAKALGKPIYLGVPARPRDSYGDEGDDDGGVNPWPIDFDYEGEPSWHAAEASSEMWDQHFHSPGLDEMWFAAQCATGIVYSDGPVDAVRQVAESVISDHWVASQGSRAQSLFWSEYKRSGRFFARHPGLTPQYAVLDGRDPVDFACLEGMVAIDIEEAQPVPNDAEAVTRSCRRQEDIESAGWRLLRLSAADVVAQADECVSRAVAFIRTNGTQPNAGDRDFHGNVDTAPSLDLFDDDGDLSF